MQCSLQTWCQIYKESYEDISEFILNSCKVFPNFLASKIASAQLQIIKCVGNM